MQATTLRGCESAGNEKIFIENLSSRHAFIRTELKTPKSINIHGASDYNKYEVEVSPTRQELRRVLDVADITIS